ncbi:MAG TPA: type II toxin-antitoxin system PemK/MazF family toxin [Nocardioidaceae bacterium]|nr:type II toxin-antitoxin system PemK/MazF family toxin [Nocardioidaceae bacterium]
MSRVGKLMRTFVRRTAHPLRTPSDEPARTGAQTTVEYAPNLDGRPDPGEVVWAWVAYEEDPSQGKDRPVLVIGRDRNRLLALQLTSKDHDLDAEDEARHGRYWMDIGSGDWDHQRRPSEVRLDRLLRLEEQGVRREGAVLDKAVFDAVIREVRAHHHL